MTTPSRLRPMSFEMWHYLLRRMVTVEAISQPYSNKDLGLVIDVLFDNDDEAVVAFWNDTEKRWELAENSL